ncbi:hypothetical protein F5Y16DRAFT_251419 [Xylariaceae sp. FL0255]|nr:hypothetical protein F5Y16DRAFT_251419 [Xylariaceae sp. FL0255]
MYPMAGSDEPESGDNGNFEHSSQPQTPPIRLSHSHYHHQDGEASAPISPLVSPYSLGMSPLSPLRRQFSPSMTRSTPSYPRSDSYPSDIDHDHEEIIQDSQDVLIQRLNDLVSRLSRRSTIRDEIVGSLHSQVDEMENVLNIPGYPLPKKTQHRRLPVSDTGADGGDAPWNLPQLASRLSLSPPAQISPTAAKPTMDVPQVGTKSEPRSKAPKMSVAEAERIVAEAHRLQYGLESVIANFKARQQESEQIHKALLSQVEQATQHNTEYQEQIHELKAERREGEMEMLNLRIQLKAIELQCLSYVPQDVDPELNESIAAWREEWSAFKRKRARKKETLFGGASETPTSW